MDKPLNQSAASQKNNFPKWFYVLMIFIPVIFFLVLEVSLRFFNYGIDNREFIILTESYPGKLFLNPEIGARYFFNLKTLPTPIPDGFDAVKKKDSFRIFVMGGSSAAGWPYPPNGSFSRALKRRLELLYPEQTIEVINLGMSAINTYTLCDIFPAVLKQQPDLILIYAGHNEYYGALGVGSVESLGKSRTLINPVLWLRKFKTVELLRDFSSWAIKKSAGKTEAAGNTLMAQVIGESTIPFDSDDFKKGIEQFEGNMRDILALAKKKKVPVILATLACNLKDHKPFISVKSDKYPPADEVYDSAIRALKEVNQEKALQLFYTAKDLDALRFRAPREINKKIKKLGSEFGFKVVDIDSIFNTNSPDGITGNNLMLDHLHPNVNGYELIARSFYLAMNQAGLILKTGGLKIPMNVQDSILAYEPPLTELDLTIAKLKVMVLTGNYPFVPKGTPNYVMQNYKMKDIVDSNAVKVLNQEIFWEKAHTNIAQRYYNEKKYKSFEKEMNALIAERPYNDSYYTHTINLLLDVQLYDDALPYLHKLHKFQPGEFTNKWLGSIALNKGNYTEAVNYLEKSIGYSQADPQVWYNLSGAYYFTNQIDKAVNAVERCLKLNPQNRMALNFYSQLKSLK